MRQANWYIPRKQFRCLASLHTPFDPTAAADLRTWRTMGSDLLWATLEVVCISRRKMKISRESRTQSSWHHELLQFDCKRAISGSSLSLSVGLFMDKRPSFLILGRCCSSIRMSIRRTVGTPQHFDSFKGSGHGQAPRRAASLPRSILHPRRTGIKSSSSYCTRFL